GHLGLRHFTHAAVHLTRRGLIKTNLGVDATHRLERSRDALGIELSRQHRLIPGSRYERHGGEVVKLVRVSLLDGFDERQLIEEVGMDQRNSIEEMLDPPGVRSAEASRDAEHLVALFEEQLRQIGAILSRKSCDESPLGHRAIPYYCLGLPATREAVRR